MEIPVEIWKEISYYLPEHFFSFNKELSKIYDESWYEKTLSGLKYKKHDHSYQDLYRRSLRAGKTKHSDINNVIKVIDCFHFPRVFMFILTFDGDLFCQTGGKIHLIDYDVKDVDDFSYIKGNKFYTITDTLVVKLRITSSSPFLAIANHDVYIAAITVDTLYLYSTEIGTIEEIPCQNNKNLVSSDGFVIQKIDGSIFVYDECLRRTDIPLVKELYPHSVKFFDNSLMVISLEENDGQIEMLAIPIITDKNNLTSSCKGGDTYYLVIDNDLYEFISELKLIEKNVKAVCLGGESIK